MRALSVLPPPPGLGDARSIRACDIIDDGSADSERSSNHDARLEDDSSVEGDARLDQLIATLSARSSQTTLMIRNVPVLYTREMLLQEWPNDATYDFLYLPYSCSMQRNLSYAFVNFTSEAAATAFMQQWQKKTLGTLHFSQTFECKLCRCAGSRLQFVAAKEETCEENQNQPVPAHDF